MAGTQALALSGAAVNVDVDSLHHYYRIHGLDEASATNVVWERGVTRFAELFARVGIKATFFVVTEDLERWPVARDIAAQLVAAGHELASHSHTHPYDLVRLHDKALDGELTRSFDILSEVRGTPCAGFRAPGYTMTPRALARVRAAGYAYDSSIFPCPPYYLAKLAVMGLMRLRGKRSQSIIGPPSVMWDERLPHVRDVDSSPTSRGGETDQRTETRGAMIELPITVLPGVRFPVIGSTVLMMRERGWDFIRKLVCEQPFVNLELHGIEMCDTAADGLDPRLGQQSDLKHLGLGLDHKVALFEHVLSDLRDALGVETLEDHVASLS